MSEPSPQPIEVEAIPLSPFDEALLTHFANDVSAQASRMDELAKQLITLNIAIPGLYATVLKLVSGESGVITDRWLLLISLGMWFLSLGLAFISLMPQRYSVMDANLSQIQTYFYASAKRKYGLVLAAGLFSFFGMCLAIFGLLI